MTEELLCAERDGVCYLTFNRPGALNAINATTKLALAAAVAKFDEDDALGVLVIAGSDCGSFSTGSDLRERAAELSGDGSQHAPTYCGTIATCRKPVIAAIDGYCVGGGLELALACDVRFASRRSSFGLPEARIGTLGNHGLDMLSRSIPLGEAMLIHLTGARIDAERAYQVGLVQGLLEDRQALFERVEEVASDVLHCSPRAVRAIKHIVSKGREMPVEYARLLSQPYRDEIHSSSDAAEGALAFIEKRPPSWVPEGRRR